MATKEAMMRAADGGNLGGRIKRARELAGYTQTEVAELLGKSRSTIAEIEGGRRRVDSLLLRDLAELFGVPPWELLKPASDSKAVLRLREALFRSASEDDVSVDDRRELARFWRAAENFAAIAEKAQRKGSKLLPERRAYASHIPPFVLEGAAGEAREWLGGDGGQCCWNTELLRHRLEERGVPVFFWPLKPDPISGLTLDHPRCGPMVLINASQVKWRRLFTLAHEVGHLWLHPSRKVVISRAYAPSSTSQLVETQANRFAAAFLMPEGAVKRALATLDSPAELEAAHVVTLQRAFGVSYVAMLVRLKSMRIIRQEQFERLSQARPVSVAARLGYEIDPSELGGPREIPFYEKFPQEYRDLVFDAWERSEIGEGKVAELLDTDRLTLSEYVRRVEEALAAQQEEEVSL